MSKFDFLSGDITDAAAFMEQQKRYAGLLRSELADIHESEIVTAVTAWVEGQFAEDWHDMGEVMNRLPTPCLNVYCAAHVSSEILDGGFGQVFFNTSRDFVGIAAEGLRAVGYAVPADVVERALKVHFDSGKKAAGRTLEDFLDFAASDDYNPLDGEFRAAFDKKVFDGLVREYVLKYQKYFGRSE